MRRTERLWTAFDQSQATTATAMATTTICQNNPAKRWSFKERRQRLDGGGRVGDVVTAQGSFQQRSSAMRSRSAFHMLHQISICATFVSWPSRKPNLRRCTNSAG